MKLKKALHRGSFFKKAALMLAAIAILAIGWRFVYQNWFLKAAYPEKYSSLVREYSQENRIDQYLVYSVIRNESGFDTHATSSIGAMGLMQLTPPTFEWAQSKIPSKEKFKSEDLYTPRINIQYGTFVLSSFLNEFGSEPTAIAAYHAGRGNVNKWLNDPKCSKDGRTLYYIPFKDTRLYVQRVMNSCKAYKQIYGANS